jgi:hypothetical protein
MNTISSSSDYQDIAASQAQQPKTKGKVIIRVKKQWA